MPHLRGRGGRSQEPRSRLQDDLHAGDGGAHPHPPRNQRPTDGHGTHPLQPSQRVSHLHQERPLRTATRGRGAGHPRSAVPGRNDPLSERHVRFDRARHGQVHHVPPVRNRLQRDSVGRGPLGRQPRFSGGGKHRLQRSDTDHRLHQLRAVRGGVPHGRTLRELPHRRCAPRHRRPLQDGGGADRPRRARGSRTGLRLFGPERDGQDGGGVATAGFRLRIRHRLRRRPHHHGGGYGVAGPPERRPRGQSRREAAAHDLLLPGLGELHGETLPGAGRQPLHGQVAATDVRRRRQKLLRTTTGHRPQETGRGLRDALRGQKGRSGTTGIRTGGRPGRQHRHHHPRTGPPDPFRQPRLRLARRGGFRSSAGRVDRRGGHLRRYGRRDRSGRPHGLRGTDAETAREGRLHRTARHGGHPVGDGGLRRHPYKNRYRTRTGQCPAAHRRRGEGHLALPRHRDHGLPGRLYRRRRTERSRCASRTKTPTSSPSTATSSESPAAIAHTNSSTPATTTANRS